MTKDKINALEGRLWKAADDLRANSKLTQFIMFVVYVQFKNDFLTAKANMPS